MTMSPAVDPLGAFRWEPQPAAEALVYTLLERFTRNCPAAALLAERMREETGTRLIDWVDYLAAPESSCWPDHLQSVGFVHQPARGAPSCFVHPRGMFPPILLVEDGASRLGVKVESVADFQSAWAFRGSLLINFDNAIEGEPLSRLRRSCISEGPMQLWVIERHGDRGFNPMVESAQMGRSALRHLEQFRSRRREFSTEGQGFERVERLISAAVAEVGVDRACDLFFAAEREYWQRRNRAAQTQKARQDRLGLGWANHDHHTYRSSRQFFPRLIGLFERLGCVCRERFYAGAEAGWGAQVLEQPAAGVVIFADVDLSPDELVGDFAHEPLADRRQLGTVGIWCALHGEAILQAGMHHLECQFDFDALRQQLQADAGIRMMKPFTDFPYLKQAFTEGEQWPVREERVAALLRHGQISAPQAEQFLAAGAIGSHLENLERNQGFKGFNQQGVNEIITATDPRSRIF